MIGATGNAAGEGWGLPLLPGLFSVDGLGEPNKGFEGDNAGELGPGTTGSDAPTGGGPYPACPITAGGFPGTLPAGTAPGGKLPTGIDPGGSCGQVGQLPGFWTLPNSRCRKGGRCGQLAVVVMGAGAPQELVVWHPVSKVIQIGRAHV